MTTSGSFLSFAVAGERFRIQSPLPTWANLLEMRYAAFLDDARECHWRVDLHRDPAIAFRPTPRLEHEAETTRFHVGRGQGCIQFDRRRVVISVPNIGHLLAAFERALVYVLIHILPRRGDALLLHACGVQLDGCGFLFVGASGAGKTTIARLAQGRGEVLGDENVVIRFHRRRVVMTAAPFWGQSTPASLIRRQLRQSPLHAIFLLRHAPGFALTPLRPAEVAFELLRTEKIAIDRPHMAAYWLHAVSNLTARIPVYRLEFAPTPDLWRFLKQQASRAAAR
ncbi:MAG: hypothetical protein GXP42_03000 [Chloroflexi bacterium]|nr:hypothetical protein [Chloroflexota bacterium]